METAWEPLRNHPAYEITTSYPWRIRNAESKQESRLTRSANGYQRVSLNGSNIGLHRVVLDQFQPNDNAQEKLDVDHINHNRSDNRLENLRWCTRRDNNRNMSQYRGHAFDFYDELGEGAIPVEHYGDRQLMPGYWFWRDEFYVETHVQGNDFRKLRFCGSHGRRSVNATEDNGKRFQISLNKFKRQEGLE
jgi:hypothetical protein